MPKETRRMSANESARVYVRSLVSAFQRLGSDAPGVMGPWRVSSKVWEEMQKVGEFRYQVKYRQMWVLGMSNEDILRTYPISRWRFKLVTILGGEVYRVKIEEVTNNE